MTTVRDNTIRITVRNGRGATGASLGDMTLGSGVAAALQTGTGTAGSVVVNGGVLGTPSSGTATNLTGLPISTGLTGAGTGVLAALGVNVGSAGAPVLFNGALGTPSSGTLTNATGLPVSTGLSGAGAGVLAALGVNVGSAGAPVLFNGALGTPSSGTLTNCTGLPTAGIVDANVTPAKLSQPFTTATAQNSTSGTNIDFSSIPSWVRKITVGLSGVSANGTSAIILRIGTGGSPATTGYSGCYVNGSNATATTEFTTGVRICPVVAAADVSHAIATLMNVSGNTWIISGNGMTAGVTDYYTVFTGSITLAGALDIVRITTVSGDTFDAGIINIQYE